eukprot:CAMPEP_0174940506 /NCGR_PEP_ID=MMETSP1355-20121228/69327_1 /TAXON_ID=464990 /ORGANISM="Hemiselmis tepida, Strain CCMP443" /LENGTH=112 /DNA_ID=CAMNT_0016187561 /DNA_START=81 /DNA_END=416 /DNA_ORIENTATION=-
MRDASAPPGGAHCAAAAPEVTLEKLKLSAVPAGGSAKRTSAVRVGRGVVPASFDGTARTRKRVGGPETSTDAAASAAMQEERGMVASLAVTAASPPVVRGAKRGIEERIDTS